VRFGLLQGDNRAGACRYKHESVFIWRDAGTSFCYKDLAERIESTIELEKTQKTKKSWRGIIVI